MIVKEITAAFLMALVIVSITFFGFKNRGPWGNFSIFLSIEFLAIWAGSIWMRPLNYTFMGIEWVSMLATGLPMALLLSILTPLFQSISPKIPKNTGLFGQQSLARAYEKEMKMKSRTAFLLLTVFALLLSISIILGQFIPYRV